MWQLTHFEVATGHVFALPVLVGLAAAAWQARHLLS
jgi:hypothetical protein